MWHEKLVRLPFFLLMGLLIMLLYDKREGRGGGGGGGGGGSFEFLFCADYGYLLPPIVSFLLIFLLLACLYLWRQRREIISRWGGIYKIYITRERQDIYCR